MDFDDIVVKESPGLCRCCLSEGCYKELGSEYSWMNETEVYADMLLECFDISISQHMEGPNGPNRLICEVCITRLRDACNFKKQVLDSEKKFVDMVGRGEFRPKVVIYQQDMKAENLEVIDDSAIDYLDNDIQYEQNDESMRPEEPHTSGNITAITLPTKARRGRPRKNPDVKIEKKAKKKTVNRELIRRMAAASPGNRRRYNLVTIFNYTTVIPFKWRRKFTCFFCGEGRKDQNDLVKHTKAHGPCNHQHKSLEKQKSLIPVKLDVSDINCEVCHQPFPNFEDMVDHLIETHNLFYDKNVEICLEKYRLIDLKCLECDSVFVKFRALVSHVNKIHPSLALPCEKCSKVFNKIGDLKAHLSLYHRDGGYKCVTCDKVFRTGNILRAHRSNEHMPPCHICNKKFSSNYIKHKHMLTEHGSDRHRALAKEFGIIDKLEEDYQTRRTSYITAKKNRQNLACVLNMSTAIPFRNFKCRLYCFFCNKYFSEPEELRQHTISWHAFYDSEAKVSKTLKGSDKTLKIDISSLSCKLCYQSFTDLPVLIEHLIALHKASYDKSIPNIFQPFKLEKYNMTCPHCNETFRYFSGLAKHVNAKHSSKKHLCSHCGQSFAYKALLTVHVKRSHSQDIFECNYCGKNFDSKMKLRSHRAKTHGTKEVQCEKCPEKLPSEFKMRMHMIKVHNLGHKCRYCDKLFVKDSFMTQHIRRIHMKEKNIECSFCNMKFFDNALLRRHIVKHTGEKNFHCDICGKSFMWKNNLLNHINLHNKSKITCDK